MKSIARTIAMILLWSVFTVACSQANPVSTVTPTLISKSVTLQYIGHSCFKLTLSDGTSIIMDPYQSMNAPREIAQFPAGLSADFVTISHFHPDHSNILGIEGDPKAFIESGVYQAGSVKITGYQGDHGLIDGEPSGDNTVFVFEIGDIKIVQSCLQAEAGSIRRYPRDTHRSSVRRSCRRLPRDYPHPDTCRPDRRC